MAGVPARKPGSAILSPEGRDRPLYPSPHSLHQILQFGRTYYHLFFDLHVQHGVRDTSDSEAGTSQSDEGDPIDAEGGVIVDYDCGSIEPPGRSKGGIQVASARPHANTINGGTDDEVFPG